MGRRKAFIFAWRRSRSAGAQPVVTRPVSAPPISGAGAAPARLFFGNGSRAELLEGPQVQPEQDPLPPSGEERGEGSARLRRGAGRRLECCRRARASGRAYLAVSPVGKANFQGSRINLVKVVGRAKEPDPESMGRREERLCRMGGGEESFPPRLALGVSSGSSAP